MLNEILGLLAVASIRDYACGMIARPLIVLLAHASLLLAQGGEAKPKQAPGQELNVAVGLGGGAGGRFGARSTGARASKHHAQIQAGLSWLATAQGENGSWVVEGSPDVTMAVTSLAMLAMLGDGNSMRMGAHKEQLKRGVKWLREQQRPDGSFAGSAGPHLLATSAMTECYLLSNYSLLKSNCTKALDHARKLRHADGGWRASLTEPDSDPALTLWGATVLGTAEFAGLLAKEESAAITGWLQGPRASMLPERGILGVNVSAIRAASLAGDQLSANVFTRLWLKMPASAADIKAVKRAAKQARNWPTKGVGDLNLHEWFCSCYALFQAGQPQAVDRIIAATAKAQVVAGTDQGSWAPVGIWGKAGGRTWTTAMAVLILETPYRYTKLVRR